MMMDRTTKFLLVAIALALWGLLLRPVFTPTPAQAQDRATEGHLVVNGEIVYYHFNGNIFQFNRGLVLQNRAIRDVANNQPTYKHLD